jgi:hypothetical protein
MSYVEGGMINAYSTKFPYRVGPNITHIIFTWNTVVKDRPVGWIIYSIYSYGFRFTIQLMQWQRISTCYPFLAYQIKEWFRQGPKVRSSIYWSVASYFSVLRGISLCRQSSRPIHSHLALQHKLSIRIEHNRIYTEARENLCKQRRQKSSGR